MGPVTDTHKFSCTQASFKIVYPIWDWEWNWDWDVWWCKIPSGSVAEAGLTAWDMVVAVAVIS